MTESAEKMLALYRFAPVAQAPLQQPHFAGSQKNVQRPSVATKSSAAAASPEAADDGQPKEQVSSCCMPNSDLYWRVGFEQGSYASGKAEAHVSQTYVYQTGNRSTSNCLFHRLSVLYELGDEQLVTNRIFNLSPLLDLTSVCHSQQVLLVS